MHHHFVYSGQIEAQINYIQSYPISNHSMMEALPLLTWHSFILNTPQLKVQSQWAQWRQERRSA